MTRRECRAQTGRPAQATARCRDRLRRGIPRTGDHARAHGVVTRLLKTTSAHVLLRAPEGHRRSKSWKRRRRAMSWPPAPQPPPAQRMQASSRNTDAVDRIGRAACPAATSSARRASGSAINHGIHALWHLSQRRRAPTLPPRSVSSRRGQVWRASTVSGAHARSSDARGDDRRLGLSGSVQVCPLHTRAAPRRVRAPVRVRRSCDEPAAPASTRGRPAQRDRPPAAPRAVFGTRRAPGARFARARRVRAADGAAIRRVGGG